MGFTISKEFLLQINQLVKITILFTNILQEVHMIMLSYLIVIAV